MCISFIKDTVIDEETPCWFEVWLLKVKDNVKRKCIVLFLLYLCFTSVVGLRSQRGTKNVQSMQIFYLNEK